MPWSPRDPACDGTHRGCADCAILRFRSRPPQLQFNARHRPCSCPECAALSSHKRAHGPVDELQESPWRLLGVTAALDKRRQRRALRARWRALPPWMKGSRTRAAVRQLGNDLDAAEQLMDGWERTIKKWAGIHEKSGENGGRDGAQVSGAR